ncbi:MAG TPA: LysM domain-containing protein, partial [Longimicrobiaceae bacterium]|nr:LysM domain-containing protein [Longimicrobiaceae bacterium]
SVRRFEFDSVRVDLPTPLPVLARLGGVSAPELAELNPHLLTGVAPAFYWVWVPKGTAAATEQAWRASEFRGRGGFAYYTLRAGESIATLAEAGMTADQLRDLNPGVVVDAVQAGDRLRVFADAARTLSARRVDRAAAETRPEPHLAGHPVAQRR